MENKTMTERRKGKRQRGKRDEKIDGYNEEMPEREREREWKRREQGREGGIHLP